MYLHLGQDVIVHTEDILGIFDLDTASAAARTRDYLARAEKEKRVVNVSAELPKSFIVTTAPGRPVYLSPVSAATLLRRSAVL